MHQSVICPKSTGENGIVQVPCRMHHIFEILQYDTPMDIALKQIEVQELLVSIICEVKRAATEGFVNLGVGQYHIH